MIIWLVVRIVALSHGNLLAVSLRLRMPSELHSRVAVMEANTGTTINDFINKAIAKEIEHGCAM